MTGTEGSTFERPLDEPLLDDASEQEREAVLGARARKQRLARRRFRWGWTIIAVSSVAVASPSADSAQPTIILPVLPISCTNTPSFFALS